MYLKEQHFLLEIAKMQSLSKAAKNLHISQPALSIFLSNLENELGCALFIRTNRNMIPTREGKLYIYTAARMINLENQFYNQLNLMRQKDRFTIRLGIQLKRSSQLIPEFVSYFSKLYPSVALEFKKDSFDNLIKSFNEEKTDALLIPEIVKLKSPLTQWIPICKDHILVVIPLAFNERINIEGIQKNPFPRIQLSALQDEIFILQNSGQSLNLLARKLLDKYQIHPKKIVHEGVIEAANQMTALGMGISFTMQSYLAMGKRNPRVVYCRLDDADGEIQFSLCYRKNTIPKIYASALVQRTKEIFEKMGR